MKGNLRLELTDLPPVRGRYILLLGLSTTTRICLRSGTAFDLEAGTYGYVGSAAGPGGLAARVGRYLRPSSRLHWHIDHLLPIAEVLEVIFFNLQVEECALADRLSRQREVEPVRGFGCSDCRCLSHLFRLPRDLSGVQLIRLLEDAEEISRSALLGVLRAHTAVE